MREKLNDNPIAQVVLVGVLLVCAAVFAMTSMGGSEEEEGAETAAPAAVAATELEPGAQPATLPPPGSGPGALPDPPPAVVSAFEADKTVVLLFVRDGGIDDRLVAGAVKSLSALSGVATFVVPTNQIARYVSIAQGVKLSRVPALVVVRPRDLSKDPPTASIQYGFQDPESVVQAVVDAGYRGPTLPYHP